MPTIQRSVSMRSSLTIALLAAAVQSALAQDAGRPYPAPAPAPAETAAADDATTLDKVTVVGSHIRGAPTTDALPVVVVGAD